MIKSYKIRLFPTKKQEQLMFKHIGSCRYIWNWMLAKQEELHTQGERHLSGFDMINLLKALKNDGEHDWLYECSNTSYQAICRDLERAYEDFFARRSGLPKFKSKKHSKPNFPIRTETLWFDDKCMAHIEKLGKVKFKTDFDLPIGIKASKFFNARISRVNEKWILTFGMEFENQERPLTDIPMGIDLGVKDLCIVAYGNEKIVFSNINKSRTVRLLNKRIKSLHRSISRKYEANKIGKAYIKTRNIEKQENQLRKLYAKISNIRHNYIHQTTHALISLLPCRVTMEDLNVKRMLHNRYLSKAVQEQCFAEFIRQMQYKCEINGIAFVQADRFYPSSKTCHNCGCVKSDLKLSDRTFICAECGYTEDRDFNAALNLQRYGA